MRGMGIVVDRELRKIRDEVYKAITPEMKIKLCYFKLGPFVVRFEYTPWSGAEPKWVEVVVKPQPDILGEDASTRMRHELIFLRANSNQEDIYRRVERCIREEFLSTVEGRTYFKFRNSAFGFDFYMTHSDPTVFIDEPNLRDTRAELLKVLEYCWDEGPRRRNGAFPHTVVFPGHKESDDTPKAFWVMVQRPGVFGPHHNVPRVVVRHASQSGAIPSQQDTFKSVVSGRQHALDFATESILGALGVAAHVEDAAGGLELVGEQGGGLSLSSDWGALSLDAAAPWGRPQ